MATRDTKVQRRTQALQMRAADLTWACAWVSHKKQTGAAIGGVWRPELGSLGTPQVYMLWELHAQAEATTGWNTEVRGLVSKEVLRKVVLSRKVLESIRIHRVTERDRAKMHGVSVGELPA